MADYIKREDVLEFSRIFDDKLWETGGYRNCITEAVPVKAIRNIPSADVAEVKHGKWYTKSLTRRGGHGEAYFVYGCSLCKKKVRYKTDFCPNCGADMRQTKDGE